MSTTTHLEDFPPAGDPALSIPALCLSDQEAIALITHHSIFGQRGRTPNDRPNDRALPHEWPHSPMLKAVTTPWHVPLAPDQLALLTLGFVPLTPQVRNPRFVLQPGEAITVNIVMSSLWSADEAGTEDKWFIFADGPGPGGEVRVHLHDSWRGYEMMELHVDAGYDGYGRDGNGASITAISWESHPERAWKDGDAAMYIAVARKVCSWVLGIELGDALEGEDALVTAEMQKLWIPPTAPMMVASVAHMAKWEGITAAP